MVGYVLPLQTEAAAKAKSTGLPAQPELGGPTWVTGPWFFRDERMYLMPGDSPMGYRLPLDSVPWVSKTDYPYMIEADPFAPRDALPTATAFGARYAPVAASGNAQASSALAQYMARFKTGHGAPREAARVMQFASPADAVRTATEPPRAPNAFESAA